ncbi:hypothetical protein RRG08_025978 [Elysia crispata]|uniref:Uncharacterized protein n=1 Tax=Elysia crispata TaxID=231223 RepID=A0AAE1DG98_9GAST|nr:hypothetical protein RRG08_025978 [Elysia crispata]
MRVRVRQSALELGNSLESRPHRPQDVGCLSSSADHPQQQQQQQALVLRSAITTFAAWTSLELLRRMRYRLALTPPQDTISDGTEMGEGRRLQGKSRLRM